MKVHVVYYKVLSFISLLGIIGCTAEEETAGTTETVPGRERQADPKYEPVIETLSGMELYLLEMGLVDVQTIASTVLVDLKYSTTDNFMGVDVYGDLYKCYLQADVAEKINKAQAYLDSLQSGTRLLIYDGVRPRSVQQLMWDTLDMPLHRKTRFVSNPQFGSLHNFGAAVDITLADDNGVALDMGAPYDDTSLVAWPIHEIRYLKSGLLTQEQVKNRQLLRRVMSYAGFFNIQSEWWHFNSCTREAALQKYKIVE